MSSKMNYVKNFFVLLSHPDKFMPKTLEVYKAIPSPVIIKEAIIKHRIEDLNTLKIVEIKIPCHMFF